MRARLRRQVVKTPYIWRYSPRIMTVYDSVSAFLRKRMVPSPYADPENKKLIVHCGYHRAGTTWFNNLFEEVSSYFGLRFQNCAPEKLLSSTNMYLCNDTRIDLTALPDHVGSHMIRDPRDMIVSGYFFHLWTGETWARRERSTGDTYQDHLNSMTREEGLMLEMERTAHSVHRMVEWQFGNPRFLELRYEDVVADEALAFERLFRHYGFREEAIPIAVRLAERHGFNRVSGRKLGQEQSKSHLRSGKSGQWREHFSDAHKARFKEMFGDALVVLGYEDDNDW